MKTYFQFLAVLMFVSDTTSLTDIQRLDQANDYPYDKFYREEFQPRLTCGGRRSCSKGLLDPNDACAYVIPRSEWWAQNTRHANYIANPVSIVFIHHTAMERCYTKSNCLQAMQKIQEFHMDVRGWDDIGYSFVVGEDGRAYEARGYDRVGAHTLGWNNVSISIAVMGNFNEDLPNGPALEAIKNVIDCGIQTGKIMPDYKLYGSGKRFYPLIKTWPHYEYSIALEK